MNERHCAPVKKPAPWSRPCEEPRLSEMLCDPIVQKLMERDHVGLAEILSLRTRLAGNPSPRHRRPIKEN